MNKFQPEFLRYPWNQVNIDTIKWFKFSKQISENFVKSDLNPSAKQFHKRINKKRKYPFKMMEYAK